MTSILAISGSTRANSSNTLFLRTLRDCVPAGVDVDLSIRIVDLPHFDPDLDRAPLPPSVATLRQAIARTDLVLICTPEYAGTLPGSMKNLLDWTVGGAEMTGRPTAWVSVAADPRRGAGAIATLATVLGYVGADIREDLCGSIPLATGLLTDGDVIADAAIRASIAEYGRAVAAAV